MPKNQQLISKKLERKSLHNKRKQGDAIDDEDSKFGRTIKALGNCRFKIMIPDYRHPDYKENTNRPLIEVEARIINDIVIVADSGDIYEIVGKMDPHQATKLFKEERIHAGLMNRTDSQEVGASSSGIEFVYEAEKPVLSDEIDINAI